jgi:negative regulator of flagellin synthesis FlgM
MKINRTNPIGNVNEYTKNLESRTASEAGRKRKAKDHVEISSLAKELLETQGTAAGEQKREKIESLKNSVSAGTYHVDARHIAEKLLPFIQRD